MALKRKPKRKDLAKSDSPEGQAQIVAGLLKGELSPPDYCKLSKDAVPYFKSILLQKARVDWTEMELAEAAGLAELWLEIQKLKKRLHGEKLVLQNKQGKPVINPLKGLIETLEKRRYHLIRLLQLHANAGTQENITSTRARLQQEKNFRKTLGLDLPNHDDDLFAKPTLN